MQLSVLADPPISRVCVCVSCIARSTADRMFSAIPERANEGFFVPGQSIIMAALRMVATGFASPFPAIVGAEPCDGWNTAWRSPISPDGAKPSVPTKKAFVAFLDEISDAGTQALSETLPPVPGFRKNSAVGIQQRKRALFKEFVANRNPVSKNRMKADQAFYGFWRVWAMEHLGDPDSGKALIDTVEAAGDEEDSPIKGHK